MPTAPSARGSNIVWADADALTGQTDGAALSGAFGPFSVGVTRPLYKANALPNGKAGLYFDVGTNALVTAIGNNTALDTLFASGTNKSFTAQVVYMIEPGVVDELGKISISPVNTQPCFLLNGTSVTAGKLALIHWSNAVQNLDGVSAAGSKLDYRYYVPGYPTLLQISYDATANTLTFGMPNGQYITQTGVTLPNAAAAGTLQISQSSFAMRGHIAQVVIDNVALSQAQLKSDAQYFQDRYGNMTGVYCYGDSRTRGVDKCTRRGSLGGITMFSYPYQMQLLLDRTYGRDKYVVERVGFDGFRTDQLKLTSGAQWLQLMNGMNGLFANSVLTYLCGVNDFLFGATRPSATASTDAVGTIQQWEALATSGMTTYLSAWATELDYTTTGTNNGQTWQQYRTTLNTNNLAGMPASAGLRVVVDLAANAFVGVAGSSTNRNYWSYDALHGVGEDTYGNPGGAYGVVAAGFADAVVTLAPTTPRSIVRSNSFNGGYNS